MAQETAQRREQAAELAALQAAYRQAMSHYWTLPLQDFTPLQNGLAPYYWDWVLHPEQDAYWRQWEMDADYSCFQAPGLHIGGWYDVFSRGTVKNFQGFKAQGHAPQKLLMGPWYHMPWHPLPWPGPAAGAGPNLVDDWQVRWFDHFLKDQPNEVLDWPVTVYQLGNGWRDLDDWPPSGSKRRDFYLHSQGRANSYLGDGALSRKAPQAEPPDVFTYSPHVPLMSAGGHSCCRPFMAPMGPQDQMAMECGRTALVYTTGVLPQPLSLMGRASLSLFAASSAVDTDFSARLSVVDECGRSTNIAEGIIRARYRESLCQSKPITPGEVYEYCIELGPVCVKIPAGQRLRLMVSSSDFPQWDRNLNTGAPAGNQGLLQAVTATQTVLHNQAYPSRLSLDEMD